MNILRRLELPLLSQAKYECLSKKRMRFQDSLNPDVLLSVFFSGKKATAVAVVFPCYKL